MRFCRAAIPALILAFWFAARAQSQATPRSASERFLIDHNRIFVELRFVRPDGSIRKALAFMDSGDPNFEFSASLAKELGLDKNNPIRARFGRMNLDVDPKIVASADEGKSMFAGMVVEANLPSTVLDKYGVTLDYGNRILTLASPASLKHEGVRIPCKVNSKTGLISVQAEIDGESYALAIDSGSAYT